MRRRWLLPAVLVAAAVLGAGVAVGLTPAQLAQAQVVTQAAWPLVVLWWFLSVLFGG